MGEEPLTGNVPLFCTEESSSGGPDRIKLESYRSSPYSYAQLQRKSSPTNGRRSFHSIFESHFLFSAFPYPSSSSTSPFDLPIASSSSSPSPFLLSDNTNYYSNAYYPPPSSYYFPYTSSPSSSGTPNYSFMPSFNYPLTNYSNFDTNSFSYMQTPMPGSSSENYNLTPLLPPTNDHEEY